ncbi:MAG: PA14 domain-containing protein [Bacteroidales bacterium]
MIQGALFMLHSSLFFNAVKTQICKGFKQVLFFLLIFAMLVSSLAFQANPAQAKPAGIQNPPKKVQPESIQAPRFDPPAHDEISAAVPISSLPFTDTVDLYSATNNYTDPRGTRMTGTEKTVWYSFVPTQSQSIFVTYRDSDVDVNLWEGPSDGMNVVLAVPPDPSNKLSSSTIYRFEVNQGTQYWLEVASRNAGSNNFTFHVLPKQTLPIPGIPGIRYTTFSDETYKTIQNQEWVGDLNYLYHYGAAAARWEGYLLPEFAETYTFSATVNGKIRVWVGTTLLIDRWTASGDPVEGSIDLASGVQTPIRIDYRMTDDTALQGQTLEWSSPSTSKQSISPARLGHFSSSAPLIRFSDPPGWMTRNNDYSLCVHVASAPDEVGASGVPIEINVTGSGNWFNNQPLEASAWTSLGVTDASGNVCGAYRGETAGTHTLKARAAGGALSEEKRLLVYADNPSSLQTEYFADQTFKGQPVETVYTFSPIDFNWNLPPADELGTNYAVRWSGRISTQDLPAGEYRFHSYANGKVRFWLNDTLVINQWTDEVPEHTSGTFTLAADQEVPFRLEYAKYSGDGKIQLKWLTPAAGSSEEPVPVERFRAQTDLYGSAITVSPRQVIPDGITKAKLRLNLADSLGHPLTAQAVKVWMDGKHSLVNGSLSNRLWVDAGVTDDQGKLSVDLASFETGEREILLQVNGIIRRAGVVSFAAFSGTGLQAEYFPNQTLQAPSVLTRIEPNIDHSWVYEAPAEETGVDNYSVRWTGILRAPSSGEYTIATETDDGARVWVNNQLVIDDWNLHGPEIHQGVISLTAGKVYPIKMEYFEDGGWSVARLLWNGANPDLSLTPIPTYSLLPNYFSPTANVTTSASDALADGVSPITVNLQLADPNGLPVSGYTFHVKVSGEQNTVDNHSITAQDGFLLKDSVEAGKYSFELKSLFSGSKTIDFFWNGQKITTAGVSFVGTPKEVVLLAPGETFTPGLAPGKTGVREPVFVDYPVPYQVILVDANWNRVPSMESMELRVDGNTAPELVPAEITLQNGEATFTARWETSGEHVLSFTGSGSISQISDSEPAPVDSSLEVADGETFFVDSIRYAVKQNLAVGDTQISLMNTQGLLAGHEVLLLTVTGSAVGTYEMVSLAAVDGNIVTLSSGLVNSYAGADQDQSVFLQVIPHYPDVVIHSGGKITSHPWDGSTGGVVILRAKNMTIDSGGTIDASVLGFYEYSRFTPTNRAFYSLHQSTGQNK